MQDRPTVNELLGAVEGFLEQEILPHADGANRFHTRVALAALRIVRRELALEDAQLPAELAGLEAVLGPLKGEGAAHSARDRRRLIAERTGKLCERIRRGKMEDPPLRQAVLEHIRATVRAKLEVSNPRWLETSSPPYPRGASRSG
jgi:hypothetical protein